MRRQPVEGLTGNHKAEQKAGCLGMALAVCSVNIISRGKGRSAVAAAAYRSGQAFQNEQDGCCHDYTRKKGVAYSEILVPQDAPDWMRDRPKLWNGAESAEVRHDARLARDVVIALQQELTREQNIELAISYAQTFVQQGMIADLSVHDTGDGNPHAHIMITTRGVDGDGFSKKKNREWDSKDSLIKWRQEYERITNEYLERYGHKERIDVRSIDVRSYAEQGIDRMPTLHLGPAAHQMEKKGVKTRLGDRNREIEEQNKEVEKLRKEAEQLKNEVVQEEIRKQEGIEKQRVEAQERSEPEPASARYNRLVEHYARAAQAVQETTEALQYRLTEKGKQDLAEQEQRLEAAGEMLRQRTPDDYNRLYEVRQEEKPDAPPLHTRPGEYSQKNWGNYDTLYTVPQESEQGTPPQHHWAEEPEQGQKPRFDALYDDLGQNKQEQEPQPHHPRGGEPGRKRKFHFPEQEKEKDDGHIK